MTRPASQQNAKPDLRQSMPETAKWVNDCRAELGVDHVNACLRRAIKGEPGFFYAIERGQFLGTPFPATHPIAEQQNMAVMLACNFAAFIALPTDRAAT